MKISTLILFVTAMALSACDSGSSKKDGVTEQGAGSYIASFEAVDGCTTGRHRFTAASEQEIETVFCTALKNHRENNFCAESQRESIFSLVKCPGSFRDINNGGSVGIIGTTFTQHYAYRETNCGTGIHTFSASTQEALDYLMCKALKDDALNNNCASSSRAERFQELNCK